MNLLLWCPSCFERHIDEGQCLECQPSHTCNFCNHVWRPADVPTNGVLTLTTKGERDGSPRPVAFANGKDFNDAVSIAAESADTTRDALGKARDLANQISGWRVGTMGESGAVYTGSVKAETITELLFLLKEAAIAEEGKDA